MTGGVGGGLGWHDRRGWGGDLDGMTGGVGGDLDGMTGGVGGGLGWHDRRGWGGTWMA